MPSSLEISRAAGPVFFFSDAHIGAGLPAEEAAKEERLLAFFSRVAKDASALVILGDLFDFWFPYRHAIPSRGFRVLSRLRHLAESGLPITFIGGNHDFWAKPFLRDQVGLAVADGPLDVDIQGRRLFLAHGDGLVRGDRGYLFLRSILRNPLAIAAYRLVHPDFGIPFATSSSELSRRHTADEPVVARRLWDEIAAPQFVRGRDAVLIGHFHHAIHWRGPEGDLIVGGDWMRTWTYTVLEGGTLTLLRWPEGGVPISGPRSQEQQEQERPSNNK